MSERRFRQQKHMGNTEAKEGKGDGVGGVAGLVEKLDHLSDTLGVDAISTHLGREEEIDLQELVLRGDEGVIVALA